MASDTQIAAQMAAPQRRTRRRWSWGPFVPRLVLAPSIAASLIYVVVFSLWTFWISLSGLHVASRLPLRGLPALRGAVEQPSLDHRLHEPVSVRRPLCRGGDPARPAAGHPDRPAGAGGGAMAHDLSLSAGDLVRGDRHGLALDLQPDDRHCSTCAEPRLDRVHLRLDRPARHGDLHHRHHRHLAGLRFRDGAVPGRAARRGPGSRSRRRRSTAPRCRASTAASCCRRSARSSSPSSSSCCNSPSRRSISCWR